MDQEEGSPAAIQKSPYHSTLIPGTSIVPRSVALRGSCRRAHIKSPDLMAKRRSYALLARSRRCGMRLPICGTAACEGQ
jgi:hypothetical protein